MKLYTVPKLYCPFPDRKSSYASEIEQHTNDWILRFHLVKSQESYEHYKQQKFATMIAKSYFFGELVDLCIWCDLNTLLFLVDDILDEQAVLQDRQTLLDFVSAFIEVLEKNKHCTIEKDGEILSALSDFWQRIKLISTEVWQEKFIQGIKEMFAAGIWSHDYIAKNKKPGLNEYLQRRQYLGAANLATDSLPVTGKINLSETIYQHPLIVKLTEAARNAICLANDLFSLGKEKEYNADFNIVTILEHSHNLNIESAIKEAAVLHNSIVREFVKTAKSALIFNDQNLMVKKYILSLGCLMKGNIIWSTENTTRYPHIYGYKKEKK